MRDSIPAIHNIVEAGAGRWSTAYCAGRFNPWTEPLRAADAAIVADAERFRVMVEEYATPLFSYKQEEIETLRAACAEVAAAAEPGHRDDLNCL
jgi:hypothetical protein